MLSIGSGSQIFLVSGVTDMRKSFDTLAAVVRSVIDSDPLSGHLFVFCNRRRDRLKVLVWEESGFWLLAELAALLAGLELSGRKRLRYHRR